MALMSHSMDGSGSGSSRGSRNNNNNNISLGVNKQSTKITKSVKRTSVAAPQHQAPPQPSKQAPPPPVYNINKNDFRNLVQQLTGSPLTERYDQQHQQPPPPPPPRAAAAPPPNPKPPNSRLHRIRPPPLNALNSSATGPPSLLRSPAFSNTVSPFFSVPPLPPLTPGDAVWAGNMAVDSPVTRYMKYLQDSMTPGGGGGGEPPRNPSPRGFGPPLGGFYSQRPMQYPMGPPLPSPHRPPPPLPSPTSQFLLPSPLPSPGSFFTLPSPGSPFPMNFFAQSPSGQFGFPGGGPLLSPLPPSPGVMFSLHSPTGRFASHSHAWREPPHSDLPREDFSFPDPDRDRRL